MYANQFASKCAMAEVLALRVGDPEASPRRARRFAQIASTSPPITATTHLRALAYLEEHLGHPEAAIDLLARAEAEAAALDQRIDLAIARNARALRIGGDEGAALAESARAIATTTGFDVRLLASETAHEAG
jgi:hypothetical protein